MGAWVQGAEDIQKTYAWVIMGLYPPGPVCGSALWIQHLRLSISGLGLRGLGGIGLHRAETHWEGVISREAIRKVSQEGSSRERDSERTL